MLRGVRADHRGLIEEVQPYHGEHVHRQIKAALGSLVLLSNIDKHRFLHPTIAVLREGDASAEVVEASPGAEVEVIWTAGELHDGAELMRWRITTPESEVTMTGDMLFPIVFGDPRIDLNSSMPYGKVWGRSSGGSPPTSRSEFAGARSLAPR